MIANMTSPTGTTLELMNRFRHGRFQLVPTDDEIKWSVWATRGWTYQEAILARQCLYFTNRQLYFERAGNVESELTTSLPACLSAEVRPEDKLYSTKDFSKNALDIYDYIQDYSSRELTFSSDVINAFLGIFGVFERKHKMRHLWGLPFVNGSVAFTRRPWYRRPTLSYSLLWKSDFIDVRRPEFPSWSWTGWCGYLGYDRFYEMIEPVAQKHGLVLERKNDSDTELDSTVELELVDGTTISWEAYQRDYHNYNYSTTNSMLSRFLHVTAYTTPVRFQYRLETFEPCFPPPAEPERYILELSLENKDGSWWKSELERVAIKDEAEVQMKLTEDDTLLALHVIPHWYDLYGPQGPLKQIYDLHILKDHGPRLEHGLIILRQVGDYWERFLPSHEPSTEPPKQLRMERRTIRWG